MFFDFRTVNALISGCKIDKNPRAPACQGHQGCGIRFHRFFIIRSHCYSAIRLCFYFFRGFKSGPDPPRSSTSQDLFATLKIHLFSNLFPKPKEPETNVFKAVKKRETSISEFIKNDLAKNMFCNTYSI